MFKPRWAASVLALSVAAACGPASSASVPAPAPVPASSPAAERPPTAAAPARLQRHSEADVRFMQHMIVHHAQALEMGSLVSSRTENESIRLLAERIEVSQTDEIAIMERWLRGRGAAVPGPHAHHAHHGSDDHAPMPGMLTPAEMAQLSAARGAEFDRLFLELMIKHHEGALDMVAELFATPGGAQEPEVFQIASEVEADQRIEIERMRRMQAAPSGATLRR